MSTTLVITAFTLSRLNFPGKWPLDGLSFTACHAASCRWLYVASAAWSLWGLGSWLYDTFDITVALPEGGSDCLAVMAFPLMVRAVRLSLDTMDRGLEVAARTLGASRTVVFKHNFTASLPGILTGTISFC